MSSNLAGHELLARVNSLIGQDLEAADEIFNQELQSWHPYVADVVAHVTRFRGKRLRPILLLLTAQAQNRIEQNHRVLAAVVEMIHTATLVHDDVLDEADTRRHVATVNSRWNNETSVLCGDFLFTHSFHLAAVVDAHACRQIGRATNKVCEGELCQVHERANIELTEDEYFKIINGKTAELTAVCSYLGAHYAGANEETSLAMQEYGRSLGMAFQIADDLLDLLGSEEKTGKSLGTDLEKQKLTLPIIHLRDNASEKDRARIVECLANPSAESRTELVGYLEHSGSLEYARNRAVEFAQIARSQLRFLPDTPARRILDELPEFASQRSF